MRMELYDGSDTPEGRDDFVIAFDIDPALSDLVDFADENEYDFSLYERRAASFSKAFRIYFNTLELTKSKESIIEVFLDDRHLTTHLAFPNRSHYEEKKLERKYRKLKELVRIELDDILKLEQTQNNQDTMWFQVGVKFASGELNHLLNDAFDNQTKNKINLTKEIKRLNLPENSRVVINPSILNQKEEKVRSDKNIFLRRKKLEEIIAYCKKNKIKIEPWFIGRYTDLIKSEL